MNLNNYGQAPLEIINSFIRDELVTDAENQGKWETAYFLAHVYHTIDKHLDNRVIKEGENE